MDSKEGEDWPAAAPHIKGVSKAEVDVFIRFLEDSQRFFLSLEDASERIFEDLLQTDIAENGEIPKSLFGIPSPKTPLPEKTADQESGEGKGFGEAISRFFSFFSGEESQESQQLKELAALPHESLKTEGVLAEDVLAESVLAESVLAKKEALSLPLSTADYMEFYLLPSLEKHIGKNSPGFLQTFASEESEWEDLRGEFTRSPMHFLPDSPEYFIEKSKKRRALQSLAKMLSLHVSGSGSLQRGDIKYIVFNIMLAERLFALYDTNGNFILEANEINSLSCLAEPIISVISSLYLEGKRENLRKRLYTWMAEPRHAFYYTVRFKQLPGSTYLSTGSYAWERLSGNLDKSAALSYDETIRIIEILFTKFFPYQYMSGEETLQPESPIRQPVMSADFPSYP